MSAAVHTDAEQIAAIRAVARDQGHFAAITQAERDVLTERSKQRLKHGDVRDEGYQHGELIQAACAYATLPYLRGRAYSDEGMPEEDAIAEALDAWPWGDDTFRAVDSRTALVRAAALLIAEIDRLDRAAAKGGAQ